MTTAALTDDLYALDELAERLHDWIAGLDPALWSSEALGSARVRLDRLRHDLEQRLEAWSQMQAPHRADERLRQAWNEMLRALPDPRIIGDARNEWREAYERLCPLYENLAHSLRARGHSVRHLRPTNLYRSVFHLCMGLSIAVAYETVFTPQSAIWAAAAWSAWAWTLETTRRWSERWNDFLMRLFGPIARQHERFRVNSATWFGTGLLVLALTVNQAPGVVGLLAVAVGDPVAGFVGRKFGRTKIIHGRSLEGTVAFIAITFIVSALWLLSFHPELSLTLALALSVTGAVVGGTVELVARRVDDNFAIPVCAGWAAAVVQLLCA